ncbi:MAG: hypothetical protein AAFS12_07265 [Cyanobacteria bacterium J06632_19]
MSPSGTLRESFAYSNSEWGKPPIPRCFTTVGVAGKATPQYLWFFPEYL